MHHKAGHDDLHLGGGSSRIRHSRLFSAVQQGFEASLSYIRPYYKKIIVNKIKGTTDLEYLTVRRQDVFII